jgi:hypothetical protein
MRRVYAHIVGELLGQTTVVHYLPHDYPLAFDPS